MIGVQGPSSSLNSFAVSGRGRGPVGGASLFAVAGSIEHHGFKQEWRSAAEAVVEAEKDGRDHDHAAEHLDIINAIHRHPEFLAHLDLRPNAVAVDCQPRLDV